MTLHLENWRLGWHSPRHLHKPALLQHARAVAGWCDVSPYVPEVPALHLEALHVALCFGAIQRSLEQNANRVLTTWRQFAPSFKGWVAVVNLLLDYSMQHSMHISSHSLGITAYIQVTPLWEDVPNFCGLATKRSKLRVCENMWAVLCVWNTQDVC